MVLEEYLAAIETDGAGWSSKDKTLRWETGNHALYKSGNSFNPGSNIYLNSDLE